jgi:hypothetical protein
VESSHQPHNKVDAQVKRKEAPPEDERSQALAIWGMVLGLLGLTGLLTFVCAIPGFIISIIALKKISKYPSKYKGKGMAITGLVVSSGLLLSLFVFMIVILPLYF